MKRFGKRCAALLLAAALAIPLVRPVRASWALGSELAERTVELGPGTALTSQSLWSASQGDLRTEHYVTYSPNATMKPVVFSGTYVASTNTVESAAAQMEEQGWRVAAAINGGFFNNDGTIVGMLMTDGILRALDVDNYTLLGFTGDGRVFIDESKPSLTVSWTGIETIPAAQPDEGSGTGQEDGFWPEEGPGAEPEIRTVSHTFPISGFNAYRNANFLSGLYLYNKDFSSRVTSGGPGVSAILRPLGEDGLRLNATLVFEVVSVTDTTQEGVVFDGVVPEGCYMLYAEDRWNPELLAALRGLSVGGQITLEASGAGEVWADAVYGLSGRYTLLRDAQIVDGLPTTANPYTAVGVKADGSAVFYTIDGRQSGWSIGASYSQVAQRLQELGCVSAVALDGGGSTTLGATLPGSGGFSLVNRPSTDARKINNTIMLVSQAGEAIFEPGAYVSASHRVVLAGAELPVSAVAYDSWGQPVDGPYLTWSASGGVVSGEEEPVYVAGTVPGSYAISASEGGGAMSIQVVDELSDLTVSREDDGSKVTALAVEPGDQVDLSVSGIWWNLPVAMDDGDAVWTADPAIGTIDEEGLFTAGPVNGEGNITVTAGGKTVVITVGVDSGCPFTDVAGHWSEDYVIRLYQLGLTTGYGQADGTALYAPDGRLTRAELLAFITRLLGVDESAYHMVELPFADNETIPNWAQNYVQAMYTLGVLKGSENGGKLYADVNSYVTREETMTFLGRILADSQPCDLSLFPDAASVSSWALPHVQTLVALNVVGGSNGRLDPKSYIDRAAIAKLLVEIYPLDKALLLPRLDLMS